MELKDTIPLMTSEDYRERFKAEYYQLKIRMDKLRSDKLRPIIERIEAGTIESKTKSSLYSLREQLLHMSGYLRWLEFRAMEEKVDLEE